jgi:hypothetical protein
LDRRPPSSCLTTGLGPLGTEARPSSTEIYFVVPPRNHTCCCFAAPSYIACCQCHALEGRVGAGGEVWAQALLGHLDCHVNGAVASVGAQARVQLPHHDAWGGAWQCACVWSSMYPLRDTLNTSSCWPYGTGVQSTTSPLRMRENGANYCTHEDPQVASIKRAPCSPPKA